MSIPERLYRIAKFKLDELWDRIDRLDDEPRQADDPATRARGEVDSAVNEPGGTIVAPAPSTTGGGTAASRPRTPEEITRGYSTPAPTGTSTVSAASGQADPLAFHYRVLGVDPGADFATVQAAYNRYAARCDPGRFEAGSDEERKAAEIRKRLDDSYRILREALDPTARRFDMLEFDTKK